MNIFFSIITVLGEYPPHACPLRRGMVFVLVISPIFLYFDDKNVVEQCLFATYVSVCFGVWCMFVCMFVCV